MKRIRRHFSYANVAATLALVFAMTGGAIGATGGFSSSGTLRACVNEEGRLKLLKSGEHCKRGQKGVSWSQTGPAGPKGAPGVAGANGSTGPMGLTGASGQPSNVMWAKIEQEGVIGDGKGVTGVRIDGTEYEVSFEKDVTNCAVVVTQNDNDVQNYASAITQKGFGKAGVLIVNRATGESTLKRFSIIAVC